MNILPALFYFFIALAAGSAACILFSKNVFKSTLYLLTCLLSIAALYVLTFAEFLAVAQIMVYAGGILVLIIFGVMLTTRISGHALVVKNTHITAGSIVSLAFFALTVYYLPSLGSIDNPAAAPADIDTIGLAIFSQFPLPFEVAGILLLIALIGAAVVTSHLKSAPNDRL